MAEDLLTSELAERIARVFVALGRRAVDVQESARRLREHGIGLVDIGRARCWIDERIYSGAQLRLRQAEERAGSLLATVYAAERLRRKCHDWMEAERLAGRDFDLEEAPDWPAYNKAWSARDRAAEEAVLPPEETE